jgi:hypothetical protein
MKLQGYPEAIGAKYRKRNNLAVVSKQAMMELPRLLSSPTPKPASMMGRKTQVPSPRSDLSQFSDVDVTLSVHLRHRLREA